MFGLRHNFFIPQPHANFIPAHLKPSCHSPFTRPHIDPGLSNREDIAVYLLKIHINYDYSTISDYWQGTKRQRLSSNVGMYIPKWLFQKFSYLLIHKPVSTKSSMGIYQNIQQFPLTKKNKARRANPRKPFSIPEKFFRQIRE